MASSSPLAALPPSVWASPEIEQAIARSAPGTIIAIARRAHRLRQDELGSLAGFSQSAISRLESGGNLAYDTRVLRIFQRLLGIPARLLGLADERVAVPARTSGNEVLFQAKTADGHRVVITVDSCTLLKAVSSAAFDAHAVDTWKRLSKSVCGAAPSAEAPVDPDIVRRLLVVRRIVNDSDNWIGSTELRPTIADLYHFVESLRTCVRGELRRELLEVAGLYAEFQGWLHQQAGDDTSAGWWTERALQQGQAAGSPELVAYAYIRMSQLAENENDADQVIGLARAAWRERGISPQLRALALHQEAMGHALAGSESACLSLLDESQAIAGDGQPINSSEYRLGSWFGEHAVETQRAACCVELGRTREAIVRYEHGVLDWATLCRTELGVHLAKLSRAYAGVGELGQAGSAARRSLAVARDCAPALVIGELRKLRKWENVPEVAEVMASL